MALLTNAIMPFILSGRSRQAATIYARTGGAIPGLCRVMDVEPSTELALASIPSEDLKATVSRCPHTIARMPARIAWGSSGQAVATVPICPRSPPGVSLAYQPPDSPRDWRVPTPKSPPHALYVRNRTRVRIRTVHDRFSDV